ncbi:bromodomain containing protein [Nitzschia inconspicua]|uniref:Bromodomain containing protein n=1 Tax=Nitzschia inconspicua TaxID=303405 RepID=A0A9K3L0Q8_9STRA|nr:bromodomain containing protein [Nitzschia inconspicua]
MNDQFSEQNELTVNEDQQILLAATASAPQSENSIHTILPKPLPPSPSEGYAETVMNMPLIDPPRWGWTAVGGVADVLPPHERARRKSTCIAYKREYQQRKRRLNAMSQSEVVVSISRCGSVPRIPSSLDATATSSHSQQSAGLNHFSQNSSGSTQLLLLADPGRTTKMSTAVSNVVSAELQKDPRAFSVASPVVQPTDFSSTTNRLVENVENTAQSIPAPAIRDNVAAGSDQQMSTNGASNLQTNHSLTNHNVQTSSDGLLQQPSQHFTQKQLPSSVVDLGTQIVGVPSHLLGLSIEKVPPENDDERTNAAEATPTGQEKSPTASTKPLRYKCTVHALGESTNHIVDGERGNNAVLDMYAYHKGREGMEARDKMTGELLCKDIVTDTNHDLDAPKATFSLTIEYPLDNDGDDNGPNKTMYTDVLDWNLADPSTPSPLDFATSIASEYGLSFGETLDLAASIEQQIEAHLFSQFNYSEPVAVMDQQGLSERDRQAGQVSQAYRYDQVIETGKGGFARPKRVRQNAKPRAPAPPPSGQGNNKKAITNPSETDIVTIEKGPASSSARRKSNTESVLSATQLDNVRDDDKVEPAFVEELKKRTRQASILDITKKCQNGVVGELEEVKNAHCHICHKRAEITFFFACGNKHHVYCLYHVNTRLGITENFVYDSCPICSLICECAKCTRRLEVVAKIFKAKSLDQNKAPADVEFPDVLEVCTKKQLKDLATAAEKTIRKRKFEELQNQRLPIVRKEEKKANGVKMRTCQKVDEMMVPKPPLTDFANETYLGKDLKIASPKDYFTIFSANGPLVANDVPDCWLDDSVTFEPDLSLPAKDDLPPKEAEVADDGSVDYCHFCMKPGNIICCDFCPRAFHEKCMNLNGYHDQSITDDNEKWECVICKKEKGGLDDDFVDGKSSMDQVFSSFITANVSNEKVIGGMEVLSIIHEMVLKLMRYDFGYMFSEPVDLTTVPDYTLLVKRPMDLGTISQNIINGEYTKLLDEEYSMDEVLVRVMKDIELVWHNCLTYNFEGSAVCRMAQVLRRRAHMIRKRSFNHKLSVRVKRELEDFLRDTENARAAMSKGTVPGAASSESIDDAKEILMKRQPHSTHKIQLKTWNPKASKTIAVLDPVSGRVVKAYGTVKGASRAVEILLELGHRCEWNAKSGLNMKLVAEKSGSDPTMLLFGYRWVYLDDLHNNRVAFLSIVRDVIEMRLNRCTFVFQSVEEALSCPDIPKETNTATLRECLNLLKPSQKWEDRAGILWRRPHIQPSRVLEYVDEEEKSNKIDVKTEVREETSHDQDEWRKCAVIKRDLVTGRNLIGFDSISAAHEDWIQTTLASPLFPEKEERAFDQFQKFYLDGDRNVDGIVWWSNPNGAEALTENGCQQNVSNGPRENLVAKTPQDHLLIKTHATFSTVDEGSKCVDVIENDGRVPEERLS